MLHKNRDRFVRRGRTPTGKLNHLAKIGIIEQRNRKLMVCDVERLAAIVHDTTGDEVVRLRVWLLGLRSTHRPEEIAFRQAR